MNKVSRNIPFFAAAIPLLFLTTLFTGKSTVVESVQGVAIDRCQTENSTFQPGEEVTYKLYYNLNFIWIPAGEAVFKIADFGDVYRVSADGRTYASYEWFFKVRDRYESYISKKTLLPNMSVRDVKEGGYTLYDKTILDQVNQKASITRGRAKDNIHENKEMDIDNCMHDILSVIYFARNLDYENMPEGSRVPVKIFMDKEEWPITVIYDGKDEEKKVKGLGKFKTIKFSPEVTAGDFFEKDAQMDIWVTDDKNKLPLLIAAPLSVGSVKAVLKDYKGLRYDMTAKVDK
jgi:hypothetical protein